MSGTVNDTKDQRYVDRIKAIAWKEARDAGAKFITREWVAKRLRRSESWVTRNWVKTEDQCARKHEESEGIVLSQESKDIIMAAICKKRSSLRGIAKEIMEKRNYSISHMRIRRFYANEGIKPYHEINKPIKTEKNREDRLWYADFLSEFEDHDFLRIAPSDEFFVYSMRKVNHQIDWIWARTIDEIPDEVRYRETVKYPVCLGIFILFTARRMMWIVKERGESWNGNYFRETVLPKVHDFLNKKDNVVSIGDTIILHDKAPGWAANPTQELLRNGPVDFFSKTEYPGNSPDLNPCEDIGAIVKDHVQAKMALEPDEAKFSIETLTATVQNVLAEMEFSTGLFEGLLLSYRKRLQEVVEADGGQIFY